MKAKAMAMEQLIDRVLGGDANAWQELWLAVRPKIWEVTGRFRVFGPLSRRVDDRENVAVLVMNKLRAHDYKGLRQYREHGRDFFDKWIAVMTKYAAYDYRKAQGPDLELEITEDPPARSQRPPSRLLSILHIARKLLDNQQQQALSLWVEGWKHDEIAGELGLASAHDADLLVRAALARLRAHYRGRRLLDLAPRYSKSSVPLDADEPARPPSAPRVLPAPPVVTAAPLDCTVAEVFIAAALSGYLDGRDRDRLTPHLAACAACPVTLASLSLTLDLPSAAALDVDE